MSLYRPRKRRVDINVVPLVDVMTVLIFFFLMTMRFEEMQSLAITPPTAESAGKEKNIIGVVIGVTKSGDFYLNGKGITREMLLEILAKTGKEKPGEPILIVADEEIVLKDAVYLFDQANKANLSPKLVTRPTT